jgi:hypothetical protein
MKKYAIVLVMAAMLMSLSQTANAQFKEGGMDLHLGFGVTSGRGFIPVYFGGNYMIKDFLSVGAELGFRLDHHSYGYGYSYNYKRSGFEIVTRADYHFNDLLSIPEKFDVFAGLDLGVAIYGDYKYEGVTWADSDNVDFLIGPHVGGKWMFTDKLGLHALAGFRSSDGALFQFGLTFKLK